MAEHDTRYRDPEGQCVWVSAGLLSHHICDRDFDCDRCPLHLALSPVAGRKGQEKAFWPKDRLYSNQHFWLKQTSASTARLGLTELAVQILHPVSRWTVERDGRSQQGEIKIVAQLSCGQAVLLPPCRLSDFQTNPCLGIDALWPAADPWLSGYLLELQMADWKAASQGWLELSQAAPLYAHHREMMHKTLAAGALRHSASGLAEDGGVPVAGLLPVVGSSAYGALLAAVLNCTLLPAAGG